MNTDASTKIVKFIALVSVIDVLGQRQYDHNLNALKLRHLLLFQHKYLTKKQRNNYDFYDALYKLL